MNAEATPDCLYGSVLKMRNIPNGSLDWTALAERSKPLANRSDPLRVGWILQNAIYPAPDGFKLRTAKAARRSCVAHDVVAFLVTVPNNVVGSIHPRAWPAILTTREGIDLWMTMPLDDAVRPQRPFADDALLIVARAGRKAEGGLAA